MDLDPDIASVAALIADRSRATMLTAMLEGAPLSVTELSRRAAITMATASTHLSRLLSARIVRVVHRGRERLYELESGRIARLLERLAAIAPPARRLTTRAEEAARVLRAARTCYDHLAGRLGVAVTDALVAQRVLRVHAGTFVLTRTGERWFDSFGLAVRDLRSQRRAFTRACLDWSERRPHLAGALGAALCNHFLEHGWVVRVRNSRALRVSTRGEEGLRRLGIEWEAGGRERIVPVLA